MKSRIYACKKGTRQQTPIFSTTPAKPMFQSRPFVVQTQQAQQSQQPDLKAALRQAERYGHHLGRMHPVAVSASIAIQPKQERVQPTVQVKGAQNNDDVGWEKEADVMGAKVLPTKKEKGDPESLSKVENLTAAEAPVQGYFEEPELVPGKVSEGGQIATVDRQKAYATKPKIDEAKDNLAASDAKFTLEQGTDILEKDDEKWQKTFDNNNSLYRIKPVYKQGALSQEEAKTEPIEGDSAETQENKLKFYKSTLEEPLLEMGNLATQIKRAWQQAEQERKKSLLGDLFKKTPQQVVHEQYTNQIVELVRKTMGMMWAAQDVAKPILNPEDRNKVTLNHYDKLFTQLYEEFSSKLNEEMRPELTFKELWMTLPNNCKTAARMLTGKSDADLSKSNDNPKEGDNYYTAFGTKYGWNNHFATVVMKDTTGENTDNLTYEAAANIESPAENGKSLGYFEIYGTKKPVQSFEYRIREEQKAYIGRQTEAELVGETEEAKRNKITSERDEDYRRLDEQMKKIKGEED